MTFFTSDPIFHFFVDVLQIEIHFLSEDLHHALNKTSRSPLSYSCPSRTLSISLCVKIDSNSFLKEYPFQISSILSLSYVNPHLLQNQVLLSVHLCLSVELPTTPPRPRYLRTHNYGKSTKYNTQLRKSTVKK